MTKTRNNRRLLLASAAAGLMLGATLGAATTAHAEEARCYGVNKCKGTGDCGGKGHSCAGKNECGGKGYLKIDKETCLKIKGGRLTPDAKG